MLAVVTLTHKTFAFISVHLRTNKKISAAFTFQRICVEVNKLEQEDRRQSEEDEQANDIGDGGDDNAAGNGRIDTEFSEH